MIKDGKTGFIIENKYLAYIAEIMMQALEHTQSWGIANNTREMAGRELSYEAVMGRLKGRVKRS